MAIGDAWKRLLNNSIQTDVRLELKDRSDMEAIRVFRENLQNLLLAAPAGTIAVLAVRPWHSHRLQDRRRRRNGQVPRSQRHLSIAAKERPCGRGRHADDSHPANTTFARLRSVTARARARHRPSCRICCEKLSSGAFFSVVVNESGASIYSASEIARQSFPISI